MFTIRIIRIMIIIIRIKLSKVHNQKKKAIEQHACMLARIVKKLILLEIQFGSYFTL